MRRDNNWRLDQWNGEEAGKNGINLLGDYVTSFFLLVKDSQ